jgi:hypothetical protein
VAVAVALFLVLLFIGLTAGFGVTWLAIVPIAVVLLIAGWFGALAASRRTPRDAIRSTRRPKLLGPGGPDDPEAGR